MVRSVHQIDKMSHRQLARSAYGAGSISQGILVLVSPAKWLKQLEKLMKRMSFRNMRMSFLVVEASFLLLGFMRRSLERYGGGCWR